MIIIIYQLFSLVIITFSEDLKEDKYYKRYLKITFGIGFLGIFMELLNWNYLCRFNCTLLTFSPLLTLLISKGIIEFYKKVIKKEGFQMQWGKLSDGIWVKNKGNLKNRGFYGWYTTNIVSFPILILTILFVVIEKNVC
ncbi:hypothetical protein GGR32_002408 [Mesonia hippocampi]|uniref:Uncharacterized protein n=1 Tax=Mesonia hippocampi TaxID=1628250 RepID=A0A840EWZ0_9FLAO|nr:hypothetical protein [Mesonia hippocampi]